MGTWLANHGDVLLAAAVYLAHMFGFRRATKALDWVKAKAKPALHEVLLAYEGKPLPSDSILVDAAVRRLVAAAEDAGVKVTPAMRDVADDLIRDALLELAAGIVHDAAVKAQATLARIGASS